MLNGEAIVFPIRTASSPITSRCVLSRAVIRKYRPNIIFTHWKNSMHKDHANCHKIVVDAAFLAAVYDGAKLSARKPGLRSTSPKTGKTGKGSILTSTLTAVTDMTSGPKRSRSIGSS